MVEVSFLHWNRCGSKGGEERIHTKKILLCGVFIASGVILPVAFHLLGGLGSVFLPMHIPVLLAGFFMGSQAGFFVGVLTPILSCLITGMPPLMPILPIMIFELGVYGMMSGYLYQVKRWPVLLALLGSMLAGRMVAVGVVYGMTLLLHIKLQPWTYFVAGLTTGLPGMMVQWLVIPILVSRLAVHIQEK